MPLLSISDLFLLPSQQESFGLAALEAMACGVPVVASSVGGLSEVIDHGRTGFLHDLDDLDGMAASGILLLSDTELHAAVAASGRRTVKERFCADLIVPRYEAFYGELRPVRFAPDYVACVLNDVFEDAKAQFLSPLMAIHYAHLVMLVEQGIVVAADGARACRGARLDRPRRRSPGAVRRHLRGPVLLRRTADRRRSAARTSPAGCTPPARATTST